MPRTQSASAHRKVLEAALELVAERGVDATSMDAVAQKSGVSKATIYKHWADKDGLLLEMLAEAAGVHGRPEFDSGHTKADLVAVLTYRPSEHPDLRNRILPHLIAYSTRNRTFGAAWRKKVMEPPLRQLRRLIRQGIQRGELMPTLDEELGVGLLVGPMLYWHVFVKDTPAEELHRLASGVVDAFWKAFAVESRP
jgi:AcrR family transcriptional regulator